MSRLAKTYLAGFFTATALLATCAQAFEIGPPITATIPITQQPTGQSKGLTAAPVAARKQVYFMNIQLNAQEKQKFLSTARATLTKQLTVTSSLPSSINLGMDGVPVLDQGIHGTCVTFANTAAIDALLGRGDYVSQLCNLTLGSYLAQEGYRDSGWDGAAGPDVINQLLQFGFITMAEQKRQTCGGLAQYPAKDTTTGSPMTLDEFKAMHHSLSNGLYYINWEPLLTAEQRYGDDPSYNYDGDAVLKQVKQVLVATSQLAGHPMRITFGTFIPVKYCDAGACATYHAKNDTWAMTQAISSDPDSWNDAGHEMIIIGYDDNAVATDNVGTKHKGLLILRNSWSADAGDAGNYYMTYEFFKTMVNEVQYLVRAHAG